MKNQYEKSSYELPGLDETKRIVKSSASSTNLMVNHASFSDLTKRHSPHCLGSPITTLTNRSGQQFPFGIIRTLKSENSLGSVIIFTLPNKDLVTVTMPYSFVKSQLITRACAKDAQPIKTNANINNKRFMSQK